MRTSLLAGVLAALAAAAVCAPARAIVSDPHLIAGPASEVTAVADAAMAEDGTGGVVYLRKSGGRDHVYVAAFRDGEWAAAQRVDVGQGFDSSWARIGAGDGGRLVVTWVQELGVASDRMYSATLDPGATGFQAPVPVDFNVGEATATHPDLAMARGGQAYLAYRVITDTSAANPPGYLGADVRVARYNGRLWSLLGTPVDRNQSVPVRNPTEGNAPRIAIDIQGQAIVAWHEPDDDFVDRVWTRRVFGTQVGIPLQVSPSTFGGLPLRGPADSFSLDVAGFGQGAVAFRQQPGQAGALTAPRVFLSTIPDVFAETAGRFGEARALDALGSGGPGPPSVAVDSRSGFSAAFASGPATLVASGDDSVAPVTARIDSGASSVAGDPLVDRAASGTGAAVVAWRELRGGAGAVAVSERRADGVDEATVLSGPRGGAVGRLVLGGSGLGDAIVAWTQGSGANAQVVAAVVDAPPDPFLVLLPSGWQQRRRIPVAWDHALNAVGEVTYSVSVDDEPVVDGVEGLRARLTRDDVGDGRHRVQIFAIDESGQETGSLSGRLRVDRNAPRVRVARRGRAVTVRIGDGPRRAGSGLGSRAGSVSFGDGSRAAARVGKRRAGVARHVYGAPGRYRVVVRARDRAGNRVVVRKRVRVP